MTAEMAADSLRGQERGITAFQQSTTIDGQDGDLDSSRGFKCFAWPLWKDRNRKCILIKKVFKISHYNCLLLLLLLLILSLMEEKA